MSSPNLHVAADDRIARETAPGSARRFLTQSLCAVVVLPLGLMAAVSVVRELAASREPVSGVVFIDNEPANGVELKLFRVPARAWSSPTATATSGGEGRFAFATLGMARGVPRGEYIATARWSPMETDGESLTRGANRLSAELASPELSPLRVQVVEGQAASPVWKLARCRCASR